MKDFSILIILYLVLDQVIWTQPLVMLLLASETVTKRHGAQRVLKSNRWVSSVRPKMVVYFQMIREWMASSGLMPKVTEFRYVV